MSKIKKIAIGLGFTAGIVAALTPMVTFADEITANNTLDVEVNIATIISMRLVSTDSSGNETLTCDSRDIVVDSETGEITDDGCTGTTQSVRTVILPSTADTSSMTTDIYVTTNSGDGYSLTIIDSDANNSLVNANGDTIAAISSEPVGSSNPGWAIKVDSGSWQAVPASTGSAIIAKNFSPDPKALTNDDHTTVTYGVAASADQASGVYTDTIIYTATAH